MNQRTVEFILSGIPFAIPAGFVRVESSATHLELQQLPPDSQKLSLPTRLVSCSLHVELQFATGTDFFINSYGLFKGAVEMLSVLQTMATYPDDLKFASYKGLCEFMEKGQLSSYSFSCEPNRTNLVVAGFSFEYRRTQPQQDTMAPYTVQNIPLS